MNPEEIEAEERAAQETLAAMQASFRRMRERTMRLSEPYRETAAAMTPRPCNRHPNQLLEPDPDESLTQSAREQAWVPVYAPCPACLEATEEAAQRERWKRCGIPGSVLDATFANFDARTPEHGRALNRVRARAARRCGVALLLGTPGCGKSHLAAATLKTVGRGRFLTHADLVYELRDTYDEDSKVTTRRFLEGLADCACLVIDDFGMRHAGRSGDEAAALWKILGARYERRSLTVLTSNEEPEQIHALLGDRLVDRMGEDCTMVSLPAGSYRRERRTLEVAA